MVVDGIRFDSKLESIRWLVLKEKESKGIIKNLQRQVPFAIKANGHLICRYVSDFVYLARDGWVVEDVKGVLTDVYRLKKKMMRILLGIEIREVRSKDVTR